MRHRRIGSTDLVVSEVGVAVWPLLAGPEARPGEDVADLLGAALDLGIGYFAATDTDDDGRAERLLGAAVGGRRDEVTVATTFGYDTTPRLWEPTSRAPWHDWSPQFAGRALDASLRRLRLEPIDLWLLYHPGMDAIESDELFEFLEAQVEKGKIRHYGVALGPGPGWGDEGAAVMNGITMTASMMPAVSMPMPIAGPLNRGPRIGNGPNVLISTGCACSANNGAKTKSPHMP